MSGSEFERENIVTDALSAAPASKPAEPAREHTWRPPAEGLYDLSLEKDSCGVGFIANIKGRKSHQIISDALDILCNLEHRGAVGADPRAGDGAGILVQTPHKFFAKKAAEIGFALPGSLTVGAYKCGKPNCRCKADPPQLHGPYALWTRKIDNKTVTRKLNDDELARIGEAARAVAAEFAADVVAERYLEDFSSLLAADESRVSQYQHQTLPDA